MLPSVCWRRRKSITLHLCILEVEDILDTGATLHAVIARLMQLGAASVKVAVLLNKFERRVVDIEPEYWALKVAHHSPNCSSIYAYPPLMPNA